VSLATSLTAADSPSTLLVGEEMAWLDEDADKDEGPQAGDWDLQLKIGIEYEPEYIGSDNYDVGPEWEITVLYWFTDYLVGVLNNSSAGVGYRVLPMLLIGAGIAYEDGRDEKDSEYLRGLGDIGRSFHATATARALLGPLVAYGVGYQDISGQDLGARAEFGIEFEVEPIDDIFSIAIATELRFADSTAMQTVFGINDQQAAGSGYNTYSPSGGFYQVGVGIEASYYFTEHWSIEFGTDYNYLMGDAASSPIVRQKGAFSAEFGIGYTF
jgi:outer membrane scaffolding protein for murein synthesis (MipA/OmpV family)